jgi:uncharacterized protein YqgC (DUF456 family)
MATADLHTTLDRAAVTEPQADSHLIDSRTSVVAPEWLFDGSAMFGAAGGALGVATAAGTVFGGFIPVLFGAVGLIFGALLGATVGRYVAMPVWAALTAPRSSRE